MVASQQPSRRRRSQVVPLARQETSHTLYSGRMYTRDAQGQVSTIRLDVVEDMIFEREVVTITLLSTPGHRCPCVAMSLHVWYNLMDGVASLMQESRVTRRHMGAGLFATWYPTTRDLELMQHEIDGDFYPTGQWITLSHNAVLSILEHQEMVLQNASAVRIL